MISDAQSLEDAITIIRTSAHQPHSSSRPNIQRRYYETCRQFRLSGVDTKIRELDLGEDLLESAGIKAGTLEKAQFLIQLISLERGPYAHSEH